MSLHKINFKPNDHIEDLGKKQNDEFMLQLISDGLNKLRLKPRELAAVQISSHDTIEHFKTVFELLVNTSSEAWVQGMIDRLNKIIVIVNDPAITIGKLNEKIKNDRVDLSVILKTLQDNLAVLHTVMKL